MRPKQAVRYELLLRQGDRASCESELSHVILESRLIWLYSLYLLLPPLSFDSDGFDKFDKFGKCAIMACRRYS